MDGLEQTLHTWIGQQTVWITSLVVIFVFRRFIESAVAGTMVFFGNDYNADDIVYLNGRPGRIIRVGMWKTTFFLYDVVNDPFTGEASVSGGSKLVVQNSSLHDMRIEKPLETVELKRYHKSPTKKKEKNDIS